MKICGMCNKSMILIEVIKDRFSDGRIGYTEWWQCDGPHEIKNQSYAEAHYVKEEVYNQAIANGVAWKDKTEGGGSSGKK